ncbi:efflux RND transporter permease subunit [Motilimonas sp. 1_MG-2023]|uniref:efflux RND transporter permease subunit n=1 Tax=Motilimonas sp. 1_MG-2023 TaxID=3062672 RepID=UPI0026E4749F|nr:efflux RND transporter permease subunit [Motilimonas sp. 1_MG-2023]MDO6525043.1 efflux RND transporter permease subunit [Motilimonas sp. 1_MG-2023]
MGISGRIASAFQGSSITPLLALVGLLLGLFAVIVTPKEEEPQIDVTFVDVFIPFTGASVQEVENLLTYPVEQIVSELHGIDTLYSFSQPGGAMLIVVFDVGVPRNEAIVGLYNQLYANLDKLPQQAGVGQPLIKPKAIDDVPIVSLTLWSEQTNADMAQLSQVATSLETELKRIPGTRTIELLGQQANVLSVRLDSQKMNAYGVSFNQISQLLSQSNLRSGLAPLQQDDQIIQVQTGQFFTRLDEIEQLIVAMHQGAPVYLKDVASVSLGAELPIQSVWHTNERGTFAGITLAIAKQPGKNAVAVAEQITERIHQLENVLLPKDVHYSITRNYGITAGDKSNTLIAKLIFATAAVIILVVITMGWREAIVVGIAITVTLAMTLFASWAWGFTLNRVSLFALIFSIGILVDDAIVVVENIHRHMAMGKKSMSELIPVAVDEVGGPTILATFTVIAALLPMAFVSGLMGPYMSPIPINASLGMLISLMVAFILSPWLSRHLLRRHSHSTSPTTANNNEENHNDNSKILRIFTYFMTPFLRPNTGKRARAGLWLVVALLILGSVALPVSENVVLKMLPFDNKSEFQVMIDLPEGSTLETSQRLGFALAQYLTTVPEVEHVQLYAGTSAPINFNGLVRHYFLRQSPALSDIQVNLVDKKHRDRSSHDIALSVREELQNIGKAYQANIKVVEVPPGPPVWSPIVAEVYGPNQVSRETAANTLLDIFKQTPDIVDMDIDLPAMQPQWQIHIDTNKATQLGITQSAIIDAVYTGLAGKDVAVFHDPQQKRPLPIRLQLQETDKLALRELLNLSLTNPQGQKVPLVELVSIEKGHIETAIMHKNMQPMIMVIADMAGPLDSPLYGMFEMALNMDELGLDVTQHYVEQPDGLAGIGILWDGEWKITYETFRDMGIAYAVGMILIYLLVVGQFKSYLVPLVIMAPIPLTIIGVLPGHALLGAQFTATSMIGMIALAGIIVRNSILLVDFIHQEIAQGVPLEQAVIHSGAVRAKPILLTALAAMIGALFILDDPIFNGLAISLIFGIFISTLLTLVVIPILYYSVFANKIPK